VTTDTADDIRTYLAMLEELHPGNSRSYFDGLRNERPGAMDATVRNIEYGLSQFPPGPVVDLGCGHGLQAYCFARKGRDVLGIDLNEYRMAWANEAFAALDTPGSFEVGDASTAMDGRRAGVVWMHRSINHLTDLPAFFRSAHGALAPGGGLVFVTSNETSRHLLRFLPFVRPGRHNTKTLKAQLVEAGFEVAAIRYHGYLVALPLKYRPPFTAAVDRFLARIPGVRALAGSFTLTAIAR